MDARMAGRLSTLPAVLTIAGSDPSGGAGLQADLLTFASLGTHGCSAVTAVTIQDSVNVRGFTMMDPLDTMAQARVVLEDISVQAIKIGMLGSAQMVEAVVGVLLDYPEIPVVLDPVLAAGGGGALAVAGLREAMLDLLLPRVTVLTPNGPEALALAPGADNLPAAGHALTEAGAEYVLITGGHGQGAQVENLLFHDRQWVETYLQERLPHRYHGSGCTLAAAIAAGLAHGLPVLPAVAQALDYTHRSLVHAYALGRGQWFPDRFFWARSGEEG